MGNDSSWMCYLDPNNSSRLFVVGPNPLSAYPSVTIITLVFSGHQLYGYNRDPLFYRLPFIVDYDQEKWWAGTIMPLQFNWDKLCATATLLNKHAKLYTYNSS